VEKALSRSESALGVLKNVVFDVERDAVNFEGESGIRMLVAGSS
jgi:hypothetical protein